MFERAVVAHVHKRSCWRNKRKVKNPTKDWAGWGLGLQALCRSMFDRCLLNSTLTSYSLYSKIDDHFVLTESVEASGTYTTSQLVACTVVENETQFWFCNAWDVLPSFINIEYFGYFNRDHSEEWENPSWDSTSSKMLCQLSLLTVYTIRAGADIKTEMREQTH